MTGNTATTPANPKPMSLTRRRFLAASAAASLSTAAARRPNVVLFMTDDHGAWATGAYGCPSIHTPRIDAPRQNRRPLHQRLRRHPRLLAQPHDLHDRLPPVAPSRPGLAAARGHLRSDQPRAGSRVFAPTPRSSPPTATPSACAASGTWASDEVAQARLQLLGHRSRRRRDLPQPRVRRQRRPPQNRRIQNRHPDRLRARLPRPRTTRAPSTCTSPSTHRTRPTTSSPTPTAPCTRNPISLFSRPPEAPLAESQPREQPRQARFQARLLRPRLRRGPQRRPRPRQARPARRPRQHPRHLHRRPGLELPVITASGARAMAPSPTTCTRSRSASR